MILHLKLQGKVEIFKMNEIFIQVMASKLGSTEKNAV